MPQSKIEEFACSDGSSGIIVNSQLIYRTECSARAWSSNATNTTQALALRNVWSRLKLFVAKIMARVMSRFSRSH